MNKKKKNEPKNRISRFVLKIIDSYIPSNRLMNIIKYNKKLQKDLDITLYNYQKSFLKNKIRIDYKEVSFEKIKKWKKPSSAHKASDFLPNKKFELKKLIEFLQKEFNSFNKKNDNKIVEKIIKEILKEKELYKQEKIKYTDKQIKLIDFNKNITWKKSANIVELNLHSRDLEGNYFFNNLYDKDYVQDIKKIIIPSGLFPNLKSLKMATNSIVPASLVMNLSKLYINLIPTDNLVFLNDISKDEIELNNLEFLYIIRPEGFNDDRELIPKKLKDGEQMDIEDDDDDSEENGNENDEDKDNEEDNDDEEDDGKKTKNKKEIYKLTEKNRIKFNCNKLKELSIQIRPEEDNTFLNNYFNLEYLYDELKVLKHDSNMVYKCFKQKFLNFKYMESLKYFKFNVILMGTEYMLLPSFKMKKFSNGLKRFSFKMNGSENNFGWGCIKEIYEENENRQIILKNYYNFAQIKDINDISLNNANILKLKNREKKSRKFDEKQVEKILCIKENNYSIQEMSLNLKYFNENMIREISKYKTLEKICIQSKIKDKKKLMKFIEDLSQLNLLKIILLRFKGNLSNNDKKIINKLIPNIKIESDGEIEEISLNYDSYDSVMEFSYD